jgi:tRNA(Leu) C34 or U34 (ribose-2'-O)-methylase TrmL
MQIALFQPDIPQNTGTILRLQAGGTTRPAVGVPVYTQSAF